MRFRVIFAALLILPAMAMACVDTIHGNFCRHDKDITQTSWDHELNLTRVYNSKSSELGWFGYGWGTPFETRLIVMPDDSAVVQDPATRKTDHYGYKDAASLQAGVEKIIAVAIEREQLDSDAAAALRKQLTSNEELRRASVLKYGIQSQLPLKAKIHSSDCAKAVVKRIAEGYQRITCEGGIDYFDLAGRLIRQEDKDYKLTIHYAGDRPDRIEDSLGQKIYLKWTATGRISEARTDKDTSVANYLYDENDSLVLTKDAKGGDTRYTYDANHRMTRVDDADNSHMDMRYEETGRIAAVTDTGGSSVAYVYRHDPDNPALHYWTTATTSSADSNIPVREAEYLLTRDASGVERLVRVIKTSGRDREDIILDEEGRIERVQKSDGSFSEFSYHPTLGKVTVVSTHEGRTEFGYDQAGNLIRVKDQEGHLIVLGYDSHNRIIRMMEADKAGRVRRELAFRYNAHDKPIKISLRGKGEIRVAYDQKGEISSVKSRQGAAMALEVTQAFQALLALVKVGGVNFCL